MGDQAEASPGTTRAAVLAAYGILDTAPEPGFDDAVMLAQEICAAPIALVSIVADDRQWFKARVGFPDGQTDLDRSVCRFVVAEQALVVIPDLAADPRTATNPLVTHDPAVRFYAGAPLTVQDGTVVGALCVLDTAPRPDGLSERQQRQLQMLARSVVQQLELRRAVLNCDAAVLAHEQGTERHAASERRWRELFERMHEGFIVGRVLRDASGRPVDWRYEEVNRAWGELVGIDPGSVVGRTVRDVLPGVEEDWISTVAAAVTEARTVRFTRQVGVLDRWYDGIIQPTGDDGFIILFVEVTERVQAQRRTDALMEIADCIRESRSVGEMTSATAAIAGRVLGASRAGYGHVDGETERVEIEPDWTMPGVASIAGRYRFADFGQIREELAQGEPLVIADVVTDPRTASDPGPMRALDIAALVNMPVRDGGRTIAVFIVQSARPRAWSEAELGFIRNVADRLESGIARLRAEAQQQVVNGEIAHRLKNSLAMVQAIANQTLRGVTETEKLTAFQERLRALGSAHEALLDRGLRGATLAEAVARVLAGTGLAERCHADGPEVLLGARATLSTSLLLHELATNALKYGALSVEAGTVTIRWDHVGEAGDQLVLSWVEEGGPPASAPVRRGFGSRLLSLGLVGTGGATIDYTPDGVRARFEASAEQLGQA